MVTQVTVSDEFGRNSMRKLTVHETEVFNAEARFAAALIEKWGLVAAKSDGEDSAGRAVLKVCSPEEVVTKACDIAVRALQAFRANGWMVEAPDISEMLRKTDD